MKILIKVVAVIFGVSGVNSLWTLILSVINFPSAAATLPRGGVIEEHFSLVFFFYFGFLFLQAAAHLLITYSLWTFKRWGLYLVMVFGLLMAIQVAFGLIGAWVGGFPPQASAYLIFHLFLYLGALLVFVRKDVRQLMCN